MLLDSDIDDDERNSFVEEEWVQITEQDNSNTCSYAAVNVYS